MAAGVVAGAAGAEADAPAGDEDDDAPEVRCFLLFLAGLASIVQSASVFGSPSAPGADADTTRREEFELGHRKKSSGGRDTYTPEATYT